MIDDAKILVFPDPRLKQACSPLSDEAIRDGLTFLHRMARLCVREKGVGLAAPQIGEMVRAVIVGKGDRPRLRHYADFRVMLNPTWEPVGNKTEVAEEGCLSHPGQRVRVRRFVEIKASWQVTGGEKRVRWFSGLPARVIQHECDHLDGINIVDKPEEPEAFVPVSRPYPAAAMFTSFPLPPRCRK